MVEVKWNSIYHGDCLDVLKNFPDNSFTAVVTDPPYGLSKEPDMREVLSSWLNGKDYNHNSNGFMNKEWDSFVPGPKVWEEIYRVLKPGGHVLSFSGTRTFDLMLIAMRLASFEVRDKIDIHMSQNEYQSYMYGTGFPKSLNIGKTLEKKGKNEEAKDWLNYGTSLKPAHEPIIAFGKGEGSSLNAESNFKYQAKASRKERDSGCSWMYWKVVEGKVILIEKDEYDILENENKDVKSHSIFKGNIHATVKPIELCRYLVRLVKMPHDNLILDPFCGSGTTLCAAILEGCNYIGIDSDLVSVELSEARTHYFKCLGEAGLK
jgi:site-specific DNA-methyltransferase (adenine-specific)